MKKTAHNQTPTRSKVRSQAGPNPAVRKGRGLVLDDILGAIREMRKAYQLPEPGFRLEQVEQGAMAKLALDGIIMTTLDRHAPEIYAKPDSILEKTCKIRRGKRIKVGKLYSGWRIPSNRAEKVLRLVLEKTLQTIVQLPRRDPPLSDGTRELTRLALHCDKLAKEIDGVFQTKGVRRRTAAYFRISGTQGLDRLYTRAEELRRMAETVRSILATTRMVKQKSDGPSPQVRFALYVLGWFEVSTGKRQYVPFKTLLDAAFRANEKETPTWVDRLEIEMHRLRARRGAWFKSIPV